MPIFISVSLPVIQKHSDLSADLETATPCMVTRFNSESTSGEFALHPAAEGAMCPKPGICQEVGTGYQDSWALSTLVMLLVVPWRVWTRWLELGGRTSLCNAQPEN